MKQNKKHSKTTNDANNNEANNQTVPPLYPDSGVNVGSGTRSKSKSQRPVQLELFPKEAASGAFQNPALVQCLVA